MTSAQPIGSTCLPPSLPPHPSPGHLMQPWVGLLMASEPCSQELGAFGNIWRRLWLSQLGTGPLLVLIGEDLRWCQTSYNAPESSHNKEWSGLTCQSCCCWLMWAKEHPLLPSTFATDKIFPKQSVYSPKWKYNYHYLKMRDITMHHCCPKWISVLNPVK